MPRTPRSFRRRAFTMTEVLVSIAIIGVLLGILLPALSGVWSTGRMTKSMNKMRQIGLWMGEYQADNTETIVPSRFDYTYPGCPDCYRGKVRSVLGFPDALGQNRGTWADILWTEYCGEFVPPNNLGGMPDWKYDAPTIQIYEWQPEFQHPFRSDVANSTDFYSGDGMPIPYGTGAHQSGEPGFFAANNFFNADATDAAAAVDVNGDGTVDPGTYWSTGQLRQPDQSIYLIDSLAGEVIDPIRGPFDVAAGTAQVDFRYLDTCLSLALDGHVEILQAWETPDIVGNGSSNTPFEISVGGMRVNRLDKR